MQGLASRGSTDIIVQKYSATGQLLWQTIFGGSAEDLAKGIAWDGNRSLYITGYYYRGTLYYENDSINSLGNTDAFVAKIT